MYFIINIINKIIIKNQTKVKLIDIMKLICKNIVLKILKNY